MNHLTGNNCIVCEEKTTRCIPAPCGPYSRWLCEEYQTARRISYDELVMAFSGSLHQDEQLGSYIDKFKKPTLEYFNYSEEKFTQDLQDFANEKGIFIEIFEPLGTKF